MRRDCLEYARIEEAMGESRHGKMREGWIKQATQVPRGLSEKFKERAQVQGGGGVKLLSTVGLALITEMPDEYRRALVRYAAQKTVFDPDELQPADLWRFLEQMIVHDHAEAIRTGKNAKWYIDRILDPELTPEPGKKASDREQAKRREGRA